MQNHIHYDTLNLFARTAALADYEDATSIGMSSSSYQEVLDHLANCEECRNQVSMISALQDRWPDISQQSELSDEENQLICDYIDGSLQPEEAQAVKQLIDTRPDAMKAALHYQSHSDQMQATLTRNDDAPERVQPVTIDSELDAVIFQAFDQSAFPLSLTYDLYHGINGKYFRGHHWFCCSCL